MQLYLYLFLFSILALPKVVMKDLFLYFWKPISPFSKLCINCLLRFHFVYCNICVLKKLMEPVNAAALSWPCACLKCVSGLRRQDKTLHFLGWILVINLMLKHGSDINEGDWLQVLFYFILLMGIGASVIGLSFFQVLDWSSLVLHFDGNVCNWIPKKIWPRKDWFYVFILENGFFRWLHICMDWNLQELLKCYIFWWQQIFLIV